jgi:hypothetical protein
MTLLEADPIDLLSQVRPGQSETSRRVAAEAAKERDSLLRTYTFGRAFAESTEGLALLQSECRLPNWDGYGAEPIRDANVLAALRFLGALPYGLSAPGIGADPDGEITLEWHRSRLWTLSISVGADGRLHYSAVLGSSRQHGTEIFSDEVPGVLLDLIRRVQP